MGVEGVGCRARQARCSGTWQKQATVGIPVHKTLNPTWTLKVCKIMAFMAIFGCLGLSFYILLGFR